MIPPLDAATARKTWRYDPETGHFFWLVSPSRKIVVGNRAGHTIDGRWRLYLNGKGYKAHRVAWLMMLGNWPGKDIDHINRDPLDNRWINLREATKHENCRNMSKPLGKTGVRGVIYRSDIGKYVSHIRTDGGRVCLGYFLSLEEAKMAYATASIKYHGEFSYLGESDAFLS